MITAKKTLLMLSWVASFSLVSAAARIGWAADCQELLLHNTYTCNFKSETGGQSSATFQFTAPTSSERDLQLTFQVFTLDCDCRARGNFQNPKFSESTEFLCVTPQSLAIAIVGKASKSSIVGQFLAENVSGNVYECKLDNSSGT
jgi:hypothetical protein